MTSENGLSTFAVDQVIEFLSTLVRRAIVTIDGNEREYDIYRTKREGNTLKKMVYTTSETGYISTARLVDVQGRTIQTKGVNVQKFEDGFMIVFSIEIKVEGA